MGKRKAEIIELRFCFSDTLAFYEEAGGVYYHRSSTYLRQTISEILIYGAKVIRTTTTNNDNEIPSLYRVQQICKHCGYEYKDTSYQVPGTDLAGNPRTVIEYTLTKTEAV